MLLDQAINGLVLGSMYALLAVGVSLIFGAARLINFAHGSVLTLGAYAGWYALTQLNLPLPLALAAATLLGALLGLLIERVAWRPLQNRAPIAPLLATFGLGAALEQLAQLGFGPFVQAFPNPLPPTRYQLGAVSIGLIDLLVAGVGLTTAVGLWLLLQKTWFGWAVRASAQDREAATQQGVDPNRVGQWVFALAAALGGLGGALIGLVYGSVSPTMGSALGLKGIVACLLGGLGSIPGALLGGLLLGVTESYGVALLGSSYRDLFAALVMIGVLVVRPAGLFGEPGPPPEALTGTFVVRPPGLTLPRWAWVLLALLAALLPLLVPFPPLLQVLANAGVAGMLALGLTLLAGTTGIVSLGHAGVVAIGGYAAALCTLRLGVPPLVGVVLGGLAAALLGTLLAAPAFRLRGAYLAVATLALAEVVRGVTLNADALTGGPVGLSGIPPLQLASYELTSPQAMYWTTLGALLVLAMAQMRLVRGPLGRTWRALRDDEIAARSYGIALGRYKALAFAVASFAAGVAGGLSAYNFSYINHETFGADLSLLALTAAIAGGLGSVPGAILGALVLSGLPEVLRGLDAYRPLINGVLLVLLVWLRPEGFLAETRASQ